MVGRAGGREEGRGDGCGCLKSAFKIQKVHAAGCCSYSTGPERKRQGCSQSAVSSARTDEVAFGIVQGIQRLPATLWDIHESQGVAGLLAGWLPRLLWNGLIAATQVSKSVLFEASLPKHRLPRWELFWDFVGTVWGAHVCAIRALQFLVAPPGCSTRMPVPSS